MKKVLFSIFLSIFILIFFFFKMQCNLEISKTKKLSKPLIRSLYTFSEKNGIPSSFEDIDTFKKEDYKELSIKLSKFPNSNNPSGYGVDVIYNDTHCLYFIYLKNKLNNDYLKPVCSLAGKCQNIWKQ